MADENGIKLLDELRGGAFEAAICTTYNVGFPFFEEVVLRRLRASGCRHVVLMADASRVAEELASPARRPSYAGDVYTLAPMEAGAAFHPKILLLLGPKKARIYVGSHNFTYAGFSRNIEVTTRLDVAGTDDRPGARLLGDILDWMKRISGDQAPAVREAIAATAGFADWHGGPAPIGDTFFLGTEPSGASLFERLRQRCPARVTRITLTAPFFDGDLNFLTLLRATFDCPVVVGVEAGRTQLDVRRARSLEGVAFVDAPRALSQPGTLHAKVMIIEDASGADALLVSGSANASAVAWLADDGTGNIEAIVGRQGRLADLDERLGLTALAGAAPLADAEWERMERIANTPPVCEGEGDAQPSPAFCFEERGALLIAQTRCIPGTPLRVDAVSGDSSIAATWEVVGAELIVTPPSSSFQLLRVEHDRGVSWAVCHHTTRLRDLAEPSSRRRLREALGSLDEIDHLEEALHAAEKVIFDDETVFRPRPKPSTGGVAEAHEADASGAATGSLSIPMASDDRVEARRKRVARDELALLLDAVLRALHRELAPTAPAGPSDQQLAGDDDAPVPPPEDEPTVDGFQLDRLGSIVRRKSKTLISRLKKIVAAAADDDDADPGRAVVRCVAVLGLLYALRRAEEKQTWRSRSVLLVDREAFASLAAAIVPRLLSKNGLVARAQADGDGDAEEVQELPGLLLWWAWVAGVDGPPSLNDDNASDIADALAKTIVVRRSLPDVSGDGDRFVERATATPRPRVSPREWWTNLSDAAHHAGLSASALAQSQQCTAGALVRAGPQRRPGVVVAVRGSTVDVADLTDGALVRKFKVQQLQYVPWTELPATAVSRG